MPQMKPINWIISLFFYSIILFIFMFLNFFNKMNISNKIMLKSNKTFNQLNWKY